MTLHRTARWSLLLVAVALVFCQPARAGSLRDRSGAYQLEVLVDGVPLRTFSHDGETWVLGQLGARYTLRIKNRSARRVEVVTTVDGRDVVDGDPGDFRNKRGYLVPAFGEVDIDGWRISQSSAAAFRFSSVSDSYAAKTGGGREVGVIGMAVFTEHVEPPRRPVYVPSPEPTRMSRSPEYGYGDAAERGSSVDGPADSGDGKRPAGEYQAAPAPASDSARSNVAGAAGAPASPPPAKSAMQRRPGLGTEYGEAVASEVHEERFVRRNPNRPDTVLGARYNDREGLIALGIAVDPPRLWSDSDLRSSADPFPVDDRRYSTPPPGWRR